MSPMPMLVTCGRNSAVCSTSVTSAVIAQTSALATAAGRAMASTGSVSFGRS
jgi:hypothetical protein